MVHPTKQCLIAPKVNTKWTFWRLATLITRTLAEI